MPRLTHLSRSNSALANCLFCAPVSLVNYVYGTRWRTTTNAQNRAKRTIFSCFASSDRRFTSVRLARPFWLPPSRCVRSGMPPVPPDCGGECVW
jgi:hypothetical protein